jgi:hypothetical protein
MIPNLENYIIDTLIDDLSNFFCKQKEILEHMEKMDSDSLQNKIFIDEFISNIENKKFVETHNFLSLNTQKETNE